MRFLKSLFSIRVLLILISVILAVFAMDVFTLDGNFLFKTFYFIAFLITAVGTIFYKAPIFLMD
jgi:hypothetical protein